MENKLKHPETNLPISDLSNSLCSQSFPRMVLPSHSLHEILSLFQVPLNLQRQSEYILSFIILPQQKVSVQ